MGKTIRQITRTKTTVDGTELIAGNDLSGDFKSAIDAVVDYASAETIDDIVTDTTVSDYVFSEVDNLTSQAVIEDANVFMLRDGAASKKITGSAFITSAKDSDFPSYKNLVVKNTVASPNNQIDITFDNLQIGRIHKTSGSYLAFNVETAGNWDTGTAAEPTNGFVYVHMWAKLDGTCNPFYSLSATSPATPAGGYVFKRLISAQRIASGNFVALIQKDNKINSISAAIAALTTGQEYTNSLVADGFAPSLPIVEYLLSISNPSAQAGQLIGSAAAFSESVLLSAGASTSENRVVTVYNTNDNKIYAKNATGGTLSVYCWGYTFNL